MATGTNDKSNITIGRPKEGGAVFFAPAGTALPATADEELSAAFQCLGYVTSDGVTVSVADEGDDVEAWGPEVVMHSQTSYGKTVNLALLESSKRSVLEFVYGKDNVTVDESADTMEWVDTGETLPRGVMVVDTLQTNGTAPRIHRQIFGDAQFTDRSGDHVYNNSDPLSYPIVVTAYKFEYGDKHVYSVDKLSAPIG